MAETLTLISPQVIPQITITDYRVSFLMKDWDNAKVVVHVKDNTGARQQFEYEGDMALTYMRFLNKSDNSVKSEQRRILERLVADGKLQGTVTGTPD